MSAKRIIQIGFLISIAGLLAFEFTIQPDISAAQLSSGALFGIGLGLILPTTLNLNLSMVPAKDTPETAGLNGTFEQLGNSIGVALVGAIMLLALSAGLAQRIEVNTVVPASDQQQLVAAVDDGVELMSDTQLTAELEAAGADAATTEEVVIMYEDSRVEAFRASVAFMIFVAVVGLVLTLGLSNRMLVEADS